MGIILSTILTSLFTSAASIFTKTVDASVETFKAAASTSATLIGTAMSHRMYWWAWGIAVVPMSAWFGLGMLGTMFPDNVPHVAAIPPGLLPYAQAVWSNLFWTGAGLKAYDTGMDVFNRWLNK